MSAVGQMVPNMAGQTGTMMPQTAMYATQSRFTNKVLSTQERITEYMPNGRNQSTPISGQQAKFSKNQRLVKGLYHLAQLQSNQVEGVKISRLYRTPLEE